MVYSNNHLDRVFHALSDPTRRALLKNLARGECTVVGLAEPFQMTLVAVSKHLKVLEAAKLVERDKRGRNFHVRLRPAALKGATDWLMDYRQFWDMRLESLKSFLEREQH